MKGDFTRQTFDPAKHYSRVLMQQGRVQLDADWNEQGSIEQYRDRTEAIDVIGHAGAPMGGAGGFELSLAGGGADLAISSGRMWVEGLLCECSPAEAAAAMVNTTTLSATQLAPDGRPLAEGQWIEVMPDGAGAAAALVQITAVDTATRAVQVSPPLSGAGFAQGSAVRVRRRPTLRSQPDLPGPSSINADTAAGRYLVYLDVHERHVTVIEDPAIRETALGGPDTTTRAKVVWQVKLDRIGEVGSGTCETAAGLLPKARTTGALTARVDPDADTGNDCTLPPTGGYRGLENQLYRIEVHQPGQAGAGATFKWQRDNGTVVSAMETIGQEAVVANVGLDAAHSFTTSDTVEASDDRTELAGLPGDLLQVTEVVRASRLVKLDHAPAGIDLAYRPKLRRWDGVGDIVDDWVHLEHGLQVRFGPGEYATGDYWLIPARTATSDDPGDIEWPRDDLGEPLARPAHGVEHAYAALAVVDWSGQSFVASSLSDCRDLFPPLTDLPSAGGPCTIVVEPGPAWAEPLLALREGTDAEICFPVGEFPADDTVVLRNLGDVVVSGAGWGTELSARRAEAVLAFENCASVFVRDLRAAGGVGKGGGGLNGALTFRGCDQVVVERVLARCSPEHALEAACIVVGGGVDGASSKPASAVRVRDCRLEVGAFQYGVLIWDSARTWVEDNEVVAVGAPKGGLRFFRREFVRSAMLMDRSVPAMDVRRGDFERARTIERGTPPFAQQGIVVGGAVATDVQVVGNTVDGALQGIHVGLSHADPDGSAPDVAGRVVIARNRVRVVLPVLPVRERRGIYVGNCDSLLIEDNRLSCSVARGAKQQAEGIRVWGRLGLMAVILANHLDGFRVGIRFNAVDFNRDQAKTTQWWIARNLAVGARPTVDFPDPDVAQFVELERNKP